MMIGIKDSNGNLYENYLYSFIFSIFNIWTCWCDETNMNFILLSVVYIILLDNDEDLSRWLFLKTLLFKNDEKDDKRLKN